MEWQWETWKKISENLKRVGKEQVVQPNGTSWDKLEYLGQVGQGEGVLQILVGGIWAKSHNSGGGFPTYFSTLKVQRHQSMAPEQVSKHAYVAALKRCGWLFGEAILFNNNSRVNVVEQIPTAFCSTTFSNNNYTCDPGTIEFCTRIIRVCINICIKITVEGKIQISNISTLKRCHLQFTTWCVVPNEIFGPWMSRRGQGRCSNLVTNMLTKNFDAPFEKFR